MSEESPVIREKMTCFSLKVDSGVQVSESGEGRPIIRGYAARFNQFSQDLGGYMVRIASDAFDVALQANDCRCLINHDPNLLVGRQESGTLRISLDEFGVKFECDMPDSPIAQHYLSLIRRGDMDGSSFSCDATYRSDYSGDTPIRNLIRVDKLYDVGPVTYPAFMDTSVSAFAAARAREQAEQIEAGARRARRARALSLMVSLGP